MSKKQAPRERWPSTLNTVLVVVLMVLPWHESALAGGWQAAIATGKSYVSALRASHLIRRGLASLTAVAVICTTSACAKHNAPPDMHSVDAISSQRARASLDELMPHIDLSHSTELRSVNHIRETGKLYDAMPPQMIVPVLDGHGDYMQRSISCHECGQPGPVWVPLTIVGTITLFLMLPVILN